MDTCIRIVFLALVGVSSVQAARAKKIVWPTTTYHAVDRDISIDARVLSKEETKELFNGKGRKLLGSKPIMPIEVVLTNQSDETRTINNIVSPCTLVTDHQLQSRLRSSVLKSIASGLLNFTVIGISGVALGCVGGLVGGLAAWGLSTCPCPCGAIFGITAGAPIGFVSGVVVSSHYLFRSGSEDETQEQDPIILQPGERYTCLLFSKDYDALVNDFSITLA